MMFTVRILNHQGGTVWQRETAVAAIEKAMEAAGSGAQGVTVEAPDGRVYALAELPEMLARFRS